jgi:hypothetical protein
MQSSISTKLLNPVLGKPAAPSSPKKFQNVKSKVRGNLKSQTAAVQRKQQVLANQQRD